MINASPSHGSHPTAGRGGPVRWAAHVLILLLGSVFLLNLNAGWLFEVPDVIPVVGHVDEALALIAVVTAARYFGWSIPGIPAASRERGSPGIQPHK